MVPATEQLKPISVDPAIAKTTDEVEDALWTIIDEAA